MRSITFGIALIIIGIMIMAFFASAPKINQRANAVISNNVDKTKEQTIRWRPIVGAFFFGAGILILVLVKRKSMKS